MLEKPSLADEKIIACLKESYGLDVTEVEFLPIGHDANAGVYRVRAGEEAYFLKVKRDAVLELSISLPRYLMVHSFEEAVAPLSTITSEAWGKVDGFNLILYPFIEEKADAELSDNHWIEFGRILKKLHTVQLSPDLLSRIPKENFVPHEHWTSIFKQINATIGERKYNHPIGRELAEFWAARLPEMIVFLDRAELLGRALQGKSLDFVLCHSDIHTGNLLLDTQNKLHVVDWDQPILAPKELDLMFVTVGGFQNDPKLETLFFEGYGQTQIDPLVLAFYRYERVVEDIAAFEATAFAPDSSDETKEDSIKWIKIILGPGGMVEAARSLDHLLPI